MDAGSDVWESDILRRNSDCDAFGTKRLVVMWVTDVRHYTATKRAELRSILFCHTYKKLIEIYTVCNDQKHKSFY